MLSVIEIKAGIYFVCVCVCVCDVVIALVNILCLYGADILV